MKYDRVSIEIGMAIESIGDFLVYRGLVEDNPVTNCGASFRMKSSNLMHIAGAVIQKMAKADKEGCPPNFVYGSLKVTWYKHINREHRKIRP